MLAHINSSAKQQTWRARRCLGNFRRTLGNLGQREQSHRLGVSSLETALLIPFITLFLMYAVQIGFTLLAHQVTQYAAYMAARSYLVYGNKTLGQIKYPYTAGELGVGAEGGLYTNDTQSAAEATAEKIIFESLPWEHERIQVVSESDWYMERVYADGVDQNNSANSGAVRVNFVSEGKLAGVELTYCMPLLFPGLATFFTGNFSSTEGDANPCAGARSQDGVGVQSISTANIPLTHTFYLGREP